MYLVFRYGLTAFVRCAELALDQERCAVLRYSLIDVTVLCWDLSVFLSLRVGSRHRGRRLFPDDDGDCGGGSRGSRIGGLF